MAAGFTMVEMMAVVVIVILLFTLLVPALQTVQTQALARKTRAAIWLLHGAVDSYANDFDRAYPPSNDGNYTTGGRPWYGRELLPLFLIGYAPDPVTRGIPRENGATMAVDDGKEGEGFRAEAQGRVLGPYGGTENLDLQKTDTGGVEGELAFADAFGRDIYYYCFSGGTYGNHNNDGPIEGSGQNYVKDPEAPDGGGGYRYFRTTFILASAGADGEWYAYFDAFNSDGTSTPEVTDDITNFLP